MSIKPFHCLFPLLACACSPDPGENIVDEPETSATALATSDLEKGRQTSATASTSASGVAIARTDDRIEFEYIYPAEAASIVPLADLLDRRAEEVEADLREQAEEGLAAAQEAGYDYRRYSHAQEWKVVADRPRFLSLSSTIATYSGGAHGNYATRSLIWDRTDAKTLAPLEFFTSTPAIQSAVGQAFCSALDRQREKKRGIPVEDKGDNPFDACPDLSELTVLLGSSHGERFDRIGLLVDPYVAGPWAEGSYEVTVPVTTAVLDAVKPNYANAFTLKR